MPLHRWAIPFLFLLPLGAQETPHPNRLAWLSIFPEPMPEGANQISMEGTSQFLAPNRSDSLDDRTHARLQGEDWGLVWDAAGDLGPGRWNIRTRLTYRSSGFLSRAIMNWHEVLGVGQNERDLLPAFNEDYHLERDGVTVFDLQKPRAELQGVDLAWVKPWGTPDAGARMGGTVQLPTGHEEELQSSGGTNFLAGLAAWRKVGPVRLWFQGEEIWISLPGNSPLRHVVDRGQFWRAWAGARYQGPGGNFWKSFGLDLAFQYNETPYWTRLVLLDKYGLQQTWTFHHAWIPKWRFGFTEKGGTWSVPEITFFASYRP